MTAAAEGDGGDGAAFCEALLSSAVNSWTERRPGEGLLRSMLPDWLNQSMGPWGSAAERGSVLFG